jgi:hypothetical protein
MGKAHDYLLPDFYGKDKEKLNKKPSAKLNKIPTKP